MTSAGPRWTGKVRLHEPALLQPLRWRRPRSIFWNAHGDLFHENVPDEWIDRVFAVCALTPQHRHMILTKRSARMREYLSDPDRRDEIISRALGIASGLEFPRKWPLANVWLGVSVEDQQRADERIPDLLATPAAVRFLSCEPLLGPIDVSKFMWPVHGWWKGPHRNYAEAKAAGAECGLKRQALVWAGATFVDWVIAGGESGPRARPMHPDWACSLRDQCQAAGVPFFFKQWGEWCPPDAPSCHGVWDHNRNRAKFDVGFFNHRGEWEYYSRGRMSPDEATGEFDGKSGITTLVKFGKKRAGRLLDGVQHDGVPAHG